MKLEFGHLRSDVTSASSASLTGTYSHFFVTYDHRGYIADCVVTMQ
jgi:hypothetical protein